MSEVLPGARRAGSRAPAPARVRGRLPATSLVAAAIVAVQVVLELGSVIVREELTVVARVTLVLLVASQLLLAWGALRRRAGPVLGLFAAEIATALGVVANGDLSSGLRIPIGIATVAVIVLLAASLRTFPSPDLPPRP